MAVYVPSKFDMFVYGLNKFPFIRIALFDAIVCLVFSFLWGVENTIVECLFYVMPMAIVARLFSNLLNIVEHSVTIFWIMSLFIGIETKILSMVLQVLLKIEGIENIVKIVSIGFSGFASLAFFLAAMGFLIRIFVALFIGN